jgi:hypothetical protein
MGDRMKSIQERIELTPDQKKAFTALVKAVNRCTKTGIFFYQVLESLGALNGNGFRDIVLEDDRLVGVPNKCFEVERCLQHLSYPSVNTACGFADDDHFIRLKTD